RAPGRERAAVAAIAGATAPGVAAPGVAAPGVAAPTDPGQPQEAVPAGAREATPPGCRAAAGPCRPDAPRCSRVRLSSRPAPEATRRRGETACAWTAV